MRSPDSMRTALEHVLRAASVAAMIALAMRLWTGSPVADSPAVSNASLDSALTAWSAASPPRATVRGSMLPDARQRDWLVALRRTGLDVRWTAMDSPAGALVVEPAPLPQLASRVVALAAPRSPLILTDALGRLDSTSTGPDGVATWRMDAVGLLSTHLGASRPLAEARDSLLVRPVLVVGQAGWESKFVVAALEENGWSVAARLLVAPGAVVRQGTTATIDTASISAVVVLDSTSSLDARAIARFINAGGGLVASGAGVSHPVLRAYLPPRGSNLPGVIGALLGPAPREGLNVRSFATRTNQVALERRGDAPVVIGRRVGSGRVLAIGYDDTWRIRMTAPDESAPAAHRSWWSSMVSSVALVRPVARETGMIDEAPMAATIAALGPPFDTGDRPSGGRPVPWEALLALLAASGLLAEWLSRRLRGVA
jgi:hypothetical protein